MWKKALGIFYIELNISSLRLSIQCDYPEFIWKVIINAAMNWDSLDELFHLVCMKDSSKHPWVPNRDFKEITLVHDIILKQEKWYKENLSLVKISKF